MKTAAILLTSVCIGLTTMLFAQETTERPYVEVNGTAFQEVDPDEFYVSILLRERYDGRNKVTIEEQEKALRKAFISLGIPDTQFYLMDVDADFVQVRWKKEDVITQKNYTLKVSNAAELAGAFKAMDENEVKDARLSRVDHSRIDSLRMEVRIQAMRAAKDKAGYLLGAIDAELGQPLIVREQEMYYGYNRNMMMETVVMEDKVGGDEGLPELGFQKIRLEQTVFVRFAIE